MDNVNQILRILYWLLLTLRKKGHNAGFVGLVCLREEKTSILDFGIFQAVQFSEKKD